MRRQGRDDRYAWPSDNRVTEVAATLGTVHTYAKRDRACSESAAHQPGALWLSPTSSVRGLTARRLLRLARLLRARYAFATHASVSLDEADARFRHLGALRGALGINGKQPRGRHRAVDLDDRL